MASLAALVDWITHASGSMEDAGSAVRIEADDDFKVRALPNEDIGLWIRPIDNSRVMTQADPRATEACWKSIGASLLAVSLLVGVLLPVAYNLLAGYQINTLNAERQVLLDERAILEQEESALLSPERLTVLAQTKDFVDPAPEHMVPLSPVANGELAMNR